MRQRYIGITDFMSKAQAERSVRLFQEKMDPDLGMMLMVGVMMSYTTLNGTSERWKDVFPKNNGVADIFIDHPLAFNTLHYADYQNRDVLSSLLKATEFGGPRMHALQLDMTWPDPGVLREYRHVHLPVRIILQVGPRALEQINNDPAILLEKLSSYGYGIDYVLLDRSAGKGLRMDGNFLTPFLKLLTEERKDMGVAIAGGLGPDTLHLVEPLIEEFPNLSIDAQGQLRSSGSLFDPIEWNRADAYTRNALDLYAKYDPLLPLMKK